MSSPATLVSEKTEHNEQVRAISLPDKAQMGCALTTCLLTSFTAPDAATARGWTL